MEDEIIEIIPDDDDDELRPVAPSYDYEGEYDLGNFGSGAAIEDFLDDETLSALREVEETPVVVPGEDNPGSVTGQQDADVAEIVAEASAEVTGISEDGDSITEESGAPVTGTGEPVAEGTDEPTTQAGEPETAATSPGRAAILTHEEVATARELLEKGVNPVTAADSILDGRSHNGDTVTGAERSAFREQLKHLAQNPVTEPGAPTEEGQGSVRHTTGEDGRSQISITAPDGSEITGHGRNPNAALTDAISDSNLAVQFERGEGDLVFAHMLLDDGREVTGVGEDGDRASALRMALNMAAVEAMEDLIPQPEPETPTQPKETPPKGKETPPKGKETPPKGKETPPKGKETPPKGKETPPKGKETPPKGKGTPPKGKETPPKGKGTPPKGKETPPKGKETPPKGKGTPPKVPGYGRRLIGGFGRGISNLGRGLRKLGGGIPRPRGGGKPTPPKKPVTPPKKPVTPPKKPVTPPKKPMTLPQINPGSGLSGMITGIGNMFKRIAGAPAKKLEKPPEEPKKPETPKRTPEPPKNQEPPKKPGGGTQPVPPGGGGGITRGLGTIAQGAAVLIVVLGVAAAFTGSLSQAGSIGILGILRNPIVLLGLATVGLGFAAATIFGGR